MAKVLVGPGVGTLTPPRSSQGERGSWDFAVPLNGEDNSGYLEQKPFMTDESAWKHSVPRQPLASQPNGFSRATTNNHGYLGADQQPSRKASPSGTDSDSLIDMYKKENRNGSQTNGVSTHKKSLDPSQLTQEEADASNWIHRDKLAQIESKELEEAGFKVGRMSRSGSRSRGSSMGKQDQAHDIYGDHFNAEELRKRFPPPIAAEDEEEDHPIQYELRTPQEVAAERERINSRTIPSRPGTSRIPVAKISPLPVPHTFVERDSPLPRSRNNSGGWNNVAGDNFSRPRARSGSVGSQVLLDDNDDSEEHSPPQARRANSNHTQGSPVKAKPSSKAAPASGARKTGNPRTTSQSKSRTASNTSPNKRPGTSGGGISRPTTSHKPEGEAPWIASMYKPDPRLPPDQQIIPTHAKRLAQEQWEAEGKIGTVYDRDFRLLNTEEFGKPPEFRHSKDMQPPEKEPEKPKEWPLSQPRIESFISATGGSEHGGYSITPKIPQSPQMSHNRMASPLPISQTPKPTDTIRIQEPPEDTKQKKGCCCIVM